ncbi:MAG: astD [Caulobacter sp.]|nr:astD [Caulobacter sp.]
MSKGCYIDGAWRPAHGAEFVSVDPATEEGVWAGAAANGADVERAVAAARAAFHPWADLPREERVAALRRYQAGLKAMQPAFAEAIARETGKALWETTAEVGSMIAKVDASIAAYDERTGVRESATGFGRAVLRHRAHGVMAVLGPYNFPVHLPNGHVVPALLAGDTVVFKPSEETPWSGEIMAQVLETADLPPGVFNLVQGGRETGAALIDQDIDGLLFTGSGAAGAHFRRHFAERPHVILALELGGNNPLVVWDAVDTEAAAALVVQSAFITTGQRCSCARRLVLPEGREGDAVLEALLALTDRLRIGPWNGEEPFMGPLIHARGANAAREAAGKLGGTALRTPGKIAGLSDAFITPGIYDVGHHETPDEEIFAPILQVRRAATFDGALSLANHTRYGLSAGLISDDAALWTRFQQRIRAGVANWNRPTTGAAGTAPFGGLGDSGNHRPSAYYAADYCAYPVASFEADRVVSTLGEIKGLKS